MMRFFTKKFKVNKTNIFLFSFLLTQIAVPTFELFKPSSANAQRPAVLGKRSNAIGRNANASGDFSNAIGFSADASGNRTTAIGRGANTSGTASTALGDAASASGNRTTAIGISADSSGNRSLAIGTGANASGDFSNVIGFSADSSGTASTAIGTGASASGDFSTAIGSETTASHYRSTALGRGATASHNRSTAIGAGAITDKDNQIVLGQSWDTVTVKGDLVVGVDGEYTLITKEGLAIDGQPLITKKANGEFHIGTNSWITIEENGRQKVYAKDENGNPIPIDYTNGTKLLINGRDVEQSINNVGALSAALTGLPTVPTDTTLACGLGTGTHGGDFAFSGGCASKVNENLSFNYAASMIMPGQDFAGDFEDQFSAKAGFVWKLGKSNELTKISLNESQELKKEVQDLKAKNDAIISQNAKLIARLEKLENIAFKLQKNEGLKLSKGL